MNAGFSPSGGYRDSLRGLADTAKLSFSPVSAPFTAVGVARAGSRDRSA